MNDATLITIPLFLSFSIMIVIYFICYGINWTNTRLWVRNRKRDLERYLDENK